MQNALSQRINHVGNPCELFTDNNDVYTARGVMTCQMGDDSMQPTIQPCELIAFADCGGKVSEPGIYVFTRNVLARRCVFIKRVVPLESGALMIISDSLHYSAFALDIDEQKDMQVHGRVIASLTMRSFV
ncbi:S24 family peptidase [Pseudescherichia vulneris]|uniref:S24 family peptidase n=1 Tax=Pseudescherichia vulneris TaxID=566 RepID=UPI00227C47EA|nr:S24 family peptidase [Pseudescherichia vulneris]WAH52451.1 S24 family peptidase [Pseudescherichia vulneris]